MTFNECKFTEKISEAATEQIDEKLFRKANYNPEQAEETGFENYSYWKSTFIAFKKNKVAMVMLTIIVLVLAFTFIEPLLPIHQDPNKIFNDAAGEILRNRQPYADHIFGTNKIGQDLWSRIWSGTRTSLLIGIVVACFDALIGIIVGALWGYVKQLETFINEAYNILNNIPTTILLILLTYIMRPGVVTLIIAMCCTGWLPMARFVRNQIMIIRDREYNLASRCLGTPTKRVIFKNLLPYLVSVIVMRFALSVPAAIGREVFMAYIGLGLPTSIPSLGNLVNEGRAVMMSPMFRYQLILPSILVCIITIAFYVMGSAFADASDPRNHI